MTVVYPCFDQTSAGGFDDLDGLLCVQRRLKFNSSWNETVVFAAKLTTRPLFFQAKLTNHVQRTRLTTPSTDEHYPLDSEDDRSGCMSKRQSPTTVLFRTYSHPDDHTIRTTHLHLNGFFCSLSMQCFDFEILRTLNKFERFKEFFLLCVFSQFPNLLLLICQFDFINNRTKGICCLRTVHLETRNFKKT